MKPEYLHKHSKWFAKNFEKTEAGAMQRPSRQPEAQLLGGYFIWRILFVSVLISGIMLALQLAITYLPFMNAIFETVPLSKDLWLLPFALGIAAFVVVEIEKAVMGMLSRQGEV